MLLSHLAPSCPSLAVPGSRPDGAGGDQLTRPLIVHPSLRPPSSVSDTGRRPSSSQVACLSSHVACVPAVMDTTDTLLLYGSLCCSYCSFLSVSSGRVSSHLPSLSPSSPFREAFLDLFSQCLVSCLPPGSLSGFSASMMTLFVLYRSCPGPRLTCPLDPKLLEFPVRVLALCVFVCLFFQNPR